MPSFQNVGGDAYKPGLERIDQFCHYLGSPQREYMVVHVAGTNGKGSTSHMMASVLQSAGYRVGLFTSPHLRDFRERMRIDGEMIGEADVVEFVERHREEMERLQLSFFEMTAAMAFDHFARCGVEVAVIETGLGGRLDATNIVTPLLSVITNIGIDHTKFLGDTIEAIASEKAGIIKSGVTVVLGESSAEYDHVFEQKAKEVGSPMIYAQREVEWLGSIPLNGQQRFELKFDDEAFCVDLDMGGEYQCHNIVTACAALRYLDMSTPINIDRDALLHGMNSVVSSTSLLGRWYTLSESPRVVCDTGHNSHGIKYVTNQLRSESYHRLICVLGFSNDKDLGEIIPMFPRDGYYIFTHPKVERAFQPQEIAKVAESLGYQCEIVMSVGDALAKARSMAQSDDLIFVGGSNFVVAEVV
ncbi:MAG: folylpolyglutamate synthase/dihydrofolate synthase family protein [Rikenellaceae bacterium]